MELYMVTILSSVYIVIFLTNIFGNSCMLIALCQRKKLRTSVNLYLSNVATADICYGIFSLLFIVDFVLDEWPFKDMTCRVISSFTCVFCTVAVVTLSVISSERYFTLRRNSNERRSNIRCVKISGVIWCSSILLCSPLMHGYMTTLDKNGRTSCLTSRWSKTDKLTFYTIHTLLTYVLSFTVMFYTHLKLAMILSRTVAPAIVQENDNINQSGPSSSRTDHLTRVKNVIEIKKRVRNIRVMQKLTLITVTFLILFTPYVVARMLHSAGFKINGTIWKTCLLFRFSTTAVNFFMYGLSNAEYRKVISSFFTCKHTFREDDTKSVLRKRETWRHFALKQNIRDPVKRGELKLTRLNQFSKELGRIES